MIKLVWWHGMARIDRNALIDQALRVDPHLYREGFADMIRSQPAFLDALIRETKRVRANGYKRYSMRTLIEFLRHHTAATTGGDEYKINNNYQASLTLLLVTLFNELDGFFNTRENRAA